MSASFIESLPPEVLTEVARLSACTKGGLPTAALNLASCSKSLHNILAPSSIFSFRAVPLFDADGVVQKSSFTNPGLWASIFFDNFSSSAVRRRSFNPPLTGWVQQLISYCRTLQFLREMGRSGYDFSAYDAVVHEQCLRVIHSMLLECDGKNVCQLEWAGAYSYVRHWTMHHVYPPESNNEWPRDDRFVAYALSNLWLLTTAERIHQEPRSEAIKLQDTLYRFCFCPWKYPATYAPLHRYRLPLREPGETPHQESRQHRESIGANMPYPLYRSYNALNSRLNTTPDEIDYYGSVLSITPPLISINAKKLYFCRQERFPLEVPPKAVSTREGLLTQRRIAIERRTSSNPTLLALYQLVQSSSIGEVRHWAQTGQLPTHITSMDDLQNSLLDLDEITSIWGDNPKEAVGVLIPDVHEWNSRRETQMPFRGGWNEDGDDPHNTRWPKDGRPLDLSPTWSLRHLQEFGLSQGISRLSQVHDPLFWRLRLCGDPFNHRITLSGMLNPLERQVLSLEGLTDSIGRLRPGRTWRPGLMKGLFQGRFGWPDEAKYLNGYRTDSLNTVPLGQDITWHDRITFLQFFGRFEEHHLVRRAPSKCANHDSSAVPSMVIPLTLDSRSVPRRSFSPGEELFPHASMIDPQDDLLVDEGGMNAFLPAGFRFQSTSGDETTRSSTTFSWGRKGSSHDRLAKYETFDPKRSSAHNEETCDNCRNRKEYLDTVRSLNLDDPAQELIDRLFESIGLDKLPRQSTARTAASGDDLVNEEDLRSEIRQQLLEDPIGTLDDLRSHSPLHLEPCDGVEDIVITGATDLRHGQAWHHYHLLGRVRLWDGLVAFLRIPKDFNAMLMTQLFYGYFESDTNFVGSWRVVVGDRAEGNLVVPPVFDDRGGLAGSGLLGHGGAGVLGDGIRVLLEGPFTMTKVPE